MGGTRLRSPGDYKKLFLEIWDAGGCILHQVFADTLTAAEAVVMIPTRAAEIEINKLLDTPGMVDPDGMFAYIYLFVRHAELNPEDPIRWREYYDKGRVWYPKAEYLYWNRRSDNRRVMVRLPS